MFNKKTILAVFLGIFFNNWRVLCPGRGACNRGAESFDKPDDR